MKDLRLYKIKYLGPTNFKGTRIKVIANQASKIIHWNYSLDEGANYRQAAQDLFLHIRKINGEHSVPTEVELFYMKDDIFALVREL